MKATLLPSADQVGLVSRSTAGPRYVTAGLSVSYTPMKLWSSRSLTKASRRESGDHTGAPWLPNTLKSGRSGSPVATPGFTGAR